MIDQILLRIGWKQRIAIVALHDIVMAALSFELSIALVYALAGQPQSPLFLWEGTLIFTIVAAGVFYALNLPRGMWHYVSFSDLLAIVKAVSLTILVFLPLLFVLTRLAYFPRSALVVEWPLLVLMLAGPRLLYRAWRDGNFSLAPSREPDRAVPVLLVGAGKAAETFIREMARGKQPEYRVVGLIDDIVSRQGRDIHGVRVMGGIDALPEICDRLAQHNLKPHRVIITDPQLAGAAVRRLLDSADRLGMPLSRLPRITDLRSDDGKLPPVRPIAVEDLLGRPQKVLDRSAMQHLISGRRVLVTGAGGTIGSELVRQIAELGPQSLALLDNGEHALYQIDLELEETHPELPRSAILGDVRDALRLDNVFRRERPEVVLHAAAFKHVPLVEANPNEAVLTNIGGTRSVADTCLAHDVAIMVLISTDKAVNPANVMGASKRVAEMICQSLSVSEARRGGRTRFVTVRFGNVLGSTGSVVPLFQRQLARGGPLTVTHPEVTRYFMTVREAVELILQAASMPDQRATEEGKIFVLDMGEPVRIQDLARQMVRLAGLRPDIDVKIEFTGLRPGEKMYEELLHQSERLVPTPLVGILLAAPRVVDQHELYQVLDQLAEAAAMREATRTRLLLSRLVPEFRNPAEPHAAAGE